MTGKPTRIVFGLNDFLVGGVQKQFVEQLKLFDRTRFDIILITLFQFKDKETLYSSLPQDLPVYRLSFRGWWDVGNWWLLYRILRAVRPQVVVSSLFFANTAFRVFKLVFGYTSIAREHNTYLHKPRLQQVIDRILAPLSYKLVAVSTTVRDFTAAQEGIAKERFQVIHNGIDAHYVAQKLAGLPSKASLRQKYGLPQEGLLFVNVARLTPQKNHGLLVDGFAAFSKQHPGLTLVIVGDGAIRGVLETQTRALGAENSIIFVGHQTDTWPFYKMADVFVSTSDMEGLSNSYLKALAAGLPLVSTKTAGTDEMLVEGTNGFFIKEDSAQAVVAALEKIVSANPHILQQGALESVKKFDLRTTVQKYSDLFLESLKK